MFHAARATLHLLTLFRAAGSKAGVSPLPKEINQLNKINMNTAQSP